MNTTNMGDYRDFSSSPSLSFSPPFDIIPALRIRYQVILPMVTIFGILANTFTLLVATRPKLRLFHYNLYIQFLSLVDLLGFIMRLPMVFDNEYCVYSHYSMAFYMTHFGWLIVNYFRGISSYVLVFLSLDRFTVIWFPDTFKNTKKTNVGRKRLIFITMLVFLTVYIPWNCILKVSGNGHQWMQDYRIPEDQVTRSFYKAFLLYSTLVLAGFPSICVIGLNIGIAVGFFKKIYGLLDIGNNDQTAKKKLYHTIAVLALNTSYAVCCFPYMVIVLYIERDRCYSKSTYGKETMVCLFESLSSLWSISNMVVFFLLNKDYKVELKRCLRIY
ncbi:unnamed protein product [Meganyctiphanes norvegica]|uniref:G-protein coupled receptors family 1 profile domain-containing protein n=1 Tax=Meganyctiphanes norvegica TaxID=48144 RepID=A0AAV2Q0W6_MEGNR